MKTTTLRERFRALPLALLLGPLSACGTDAPLNTSMGSTETDNESAAQERSDPPPPLSHWSSAASFPGQPVAYQRAVALQGKLFVLGGRSANQTESTGQLATAVHAFDPEKNSWEVHPDMPVALDQPNIVATEDRLWLIGGRRSAQVYSYDSRAREWTEVGERPLNAPVGASALTAEGNQIYIAGGVYEDESNPRGLRVSTFSRYDTTRDVWEDLPEMPKENAYFGAAIIDGVIYTTGGSTEVGDVARPGQTFAFDLTLEKWTEQALLPSAVSSFASAAVGGRFYVAGGIIGVTGRIDFEVQVYDPALDEWSFTTDMLTPRFATGAAALSGSLYVVGGVIQTGEAMFDVTPVLEVLEP